MMLLLLACSPSGPKLPEGGGESAPVSDSQPDSPSGGDSDSGSNSGSDSDAPPTGFVLQHDDGLALPLIDVGDPAPSGTLSVTNIGDADGTLAWSVSGDFAADGSPVTLSPGDTYEITVRYTGATDAPTLETGALSIDGATLYLSAAVADPELPPSLSWTTIDGGRYTLVGLPSAPYPDQGEPYTDDTVLILVPDGLSDPGTVEVVTHLHGHNATVMEVAEEQYLLRQHILSGRDAVLVIPQGPVEASDSDFGNLEETDGHLNLMRDVITLLYREAVVQRPGYGKMVLTSHSGGYKGTAAILSVGGLPIHAVHLFDSLYGYSSTYQDFADAGGVLRSIYTSSGGTDDNNRALRTALRSDGVDVAEGFSDQELADALVNIGYTTSSHSGCVSDERNYARWLSWSGLRHRPDAAPELLATVVEGGQARVKWQTGGGDPALVTVEGSSDGENWSTLAESSAGAATVSALPYLRVRAGDGAPSDTYGATGGDWLIVDGYDRVLTGSWGQPTHTFAALVGVAVGAPFSVASNEAITSGVVSLSDYDHVIWLLGDESSADRTFTDDEKDAIEDYVDGGGRIIVSGSEVGYATDSGWLSSVLSATYVADDAGTDTADGYTFGALYPEEYPDVFTGPDVLWTYSTGGGAAVGADHQVIVVGFGLENLSDADRGPALASLTGWLE